MTEPSAEAAEHKAKPCPFCGGLHLEVIGGVISLILCRDCNTAGPVDYKNCKNTEDAYAAWNKRKSDA